MKTSHKIVEYISKNTQASGRELVDYLGSITSRAVRKQLKNLLEKGILRKEGRPPKVFYSIFPKLSDKKNIYDKSSLDNKTRHIINNRYLFITPSGHIEKGWGGFITWCEKTKQDPIKTAREYIETLKKYDVYRRNDLIDGTKKIKNTFNTLFLDKVFYLDFYSIERFGKTKLGQMLLYAKQSQDRVLIKSLINVIRIRIMTVIKKYHIDGILFIPPTVKREVQFIKEMEKGLNLPIQSLSVAKIKTQVIIPQKTLSKLEYRIENAHKTIIVEETKICKNILLVDDAVGSGATLNEVASQVYHKGICRGKIIGLAITGSYKGFDVISEV